MTEHDSPFKSAPGLRRIFQAFGYSLKGLQAAFRHEAAFRQELLAVLVLAPLAFVLGTSAWQVVVLLGVLLLVLVVELLNSAIEALADAVSTDHHPLLGRAKDLGSAAVLFSIGIAALVWLAALGSRFIWAG